MKKYEIHKKWSEDVTHLISRLLGSLFHVMSLASAISASYKKTWYFWKVYRDFKLFMGIRIRETNSDTKLIAISWDQMYDWFFDMFS